MIDLGDAVVTSACVPPRCIAVSGDGPCADARRVAAGPGRVGGRGLPLQWPRSGELPGPPLRWRTAAAGMAASGAAAGAAGSRNDTHTACAPASRHHGRGPPACFRQAAGGWHGRACGVDQPARRCAALRAGAAAARAGIGSAPSWPRPAGRTGVERPGVRRLPIAPGHARVPPAAAERQLPIQTLHHGQLRSVQPLAAAGERRAGYGRAR